MELEITRTRFIFDLIIFTLSCITATVLRFTNLPQPTKRGFFCDDTSIRYPHNGETVTEVVMSISSFAIGIILITVSELFLSYSSTSVSMKKLGRIAGIKCSSGILIAYKHLYSFILSIVIVFLIQWNLARGIGRLRPGFINMCKPDIDLASCTSSEYITDYNCTSSDPYADYSSRTSFPSGHTSITVCSATYLSFYVWKRWDRKLSLEKLLISILLYAGAITIAVTRFTDNLHHATDIIGGIILGILVGFTMERYAHGWNTSRSEVDNQDENRSLLQPESSRNENND